MLPQSLLSSCANRELSPHPRVNAPPSRALYHPVPTAHGRGCLFLPETGVKT
jgi:hypothetical protein